MNTVKHLLPMLLLAVAFTHAADVKAESESGAGKKVSSMEDYQYVFCKEFEQAQDTVDIETILEKMEKSPYAKDLIEFWTTPACHAPMKNDIKVPIIFNTATDVFKSEKFQEAVYDYFESEKKQPDVWLRVINTKTSDGYTFLDFMQYNIAGGDYRSKATMGAALRIVSFLCQHGGVYSKYRDTARCP